LASARRYILRGLVTGRRRLGPAGEGEVAGEGPVAVVVDAASRHIRASQGRRDVGADGVGTAVLDRGVIGRRHVCAVLCCACAVL
jgi:hypothetical protein